MNVLKTLTAVFRYAQIQRAAIPAPVRLVMI